MKIAKSTISWKWSEPSEFARSQLPILWLASDFQKAEQSETDREREIHEHDINELLGSPGAYTCLQRAFRRGLSRNSAWSSEHLPLHLAADLRAAAKVFKRGVPVVPGPPDSHSNSGVSSVFFADSISEALASVTQSDAVFADANVHRIWRQSLPRHSQRIEVSESQKTLYTVSRIAKMIPADCKRVVIIGGGVLGDLAGFAAALKHKPTVYFPTTLLAMADSSIGGKTGANFEPWGKNQVGMFHPPQLVYITSDWLKSLDERPLKAGLAECLKHALIAGNDSLWTQLIDIGKGSHWSIISEILPEIIQIKTEIVERDPFEQGERAVLNFGHTLGHAIEGLSLSVDGESALNHGEAVAIGIAYALVLSEKEYSFKNARRYISDFREAGLIPKVSQEVRDNLHLLEDYMLQDKKNSSGEDVNWVLLIKPGKFAQTIDKDSQKTWTIPLKTGFDLETVRSILR